MRVVGGWGGVGGGRNGESLNLMGVVISTRELMVNSKRGSLKLTLHVYREEVGSHIYIYILVREASKK